MSRFKGALRVLWLALYRNHQCRDIRKKIVALAAAQQFVWETEELLEQRVQQHRNALTRPWLCGMHFDLLDEVDMRVERFEGRTRDYEGLALQMIRLKCHDAKLKPHWRWLGFY